jgi:uncharacterized protein (TIGR03437 family)
LGRLRRFSYNLKQEAILLRSISVTAVLLLAGVVASYAQNKAHPAAGNSLGAIFGSNLASTLPQADSVPGSISAISNAAGGQTGVYPNSWVSIYGANFTNPGFLDVWDNSIVDGKLPTTLDGVSVSIGGQPAYVYFVSAGQINVIAPNVGLGTMPVTVTNTAGVSQSFTVNSQQFGPAFFPWPGGQPVATRQDFSYAAKNGTFPGASTTPAKPGDVIILWGTGFGPTTPAAPVGQQTPPNTYLTANPVTVTIGGVQAQVFGAALAPGFAGLYQVAIQVPASMGNGDFPIIATVSGAQSPSSMNITIHN